MLVWKLLFQSKIARIKEELDSWSNASNFILAPTTQNLTPVMFYEFHPVDEQSIKEYIWRLNKTYCRLDPINISKIAKAYESAVPFVSQLVNILLIVFL